MKYIESQTPHEKTRKRNREPIPEGARFLSTPQAGTYLGVSTTFLEKARHFKNGPPFIALTPQCIRYRVEDLDRWATARRTDPEAV